MNLLTIPLLFTNPRLCPSCVHNLRKAIYIELKFKFTFIYICVFISMYYGQNEKEI